MSDTKTEAAKATEPDEPTIPRERLIEEARAFTGFAPHEVAGALDGERKQNFTVAEAKKLTEKWLKAEVAVDTVEEV